MKTALTPMDFARRTRSLYADREAVVDGKLRLSYSGFFDRCDRLASVLQTLGIEPGDRIVYISPNTLSQLEAFYSVPQVGAIIVPVNYRLSAGDFSYIINHCGAKMVCVASDYLEIIDSLRDEIPTVKQFVALEGVNGVGRADTTQLAWLDYRDVLSRAGTEYVAPDIDENDLIAINYTSGTTGHPKGVMISHRNAYMNIVGTLLHFDISARDRYLWTVPMFHANGWTFVWTITARGGTHVCLRQAKPELIFNTIRQEKVTMFCAAPAVLISMVSAPERVRRDLPRDVRLITAGAPPAAATIERIEKEFGWKLTQVYGLTETAPFISVCEQRPEHEHLSASELATVKSRQGVELLTSGELRVLDSNDQEVPRDGQTMGEITVRGNVVMSGYYNAPEATGRAFRNGWFRTGDAAVVHPDGYLEIRDRFKDIIISGGENISSVEVEGVLLRHPAVQEVSVVGMPDEKWGESPHAFVVLKPETASTDDELRTFCRHHMAHFKTPQWFSFIDELPKTATGKVQKYRLRKQTSAIHRQ